MPDRLAKSLVDAAVELYRRRLWTQVPGDTPILVRVPDEEHPLVATLVGQGHTDYGLMMLRGERAFACFQRMTSGEGEVLAERGDMLSVTFERLGAIEGPFRAPLRAAGFSARREQAAPLFLAKSPGQFARPPSRKELRILAACLRCFLAADDAGELQPTPLDQRRRRVLEIRMTERAGKPRVAARRVPWPEATEHLPSLGPLALDPGLAELPRLDERWVASFPVLPAGIRGETRTPRVFLLAVDGTGYLLSNEIVLGGDVQTVAERLTAEIRGGGPRSRQGRPRELHFASRILHDALAPALASMGVRTSLGEEPPFLTELTEALRGFSGAIGAEKPRPSETMEEWKELDRQAISFLEEEAHARRLFTPRSIARYFGSQEIAVRAFNELKESSPLPAFLEWLYCDWRPTRRSKTLVERILARKRLDPGLRTLLEARRDAALSIYRVDSCEPGALLEVEDIFTGERRTVHDVAMSGCGLEGFFVPLRLMKVADWTFPCTAGPPLGHFQISGAVAHLESRGTELTPEAMRAALGGLGSLWGWLLRELDRAPQLTNTDGDPFELLTATFRVEDAAKLSEALAERSDVEADPEGGWTWIRPGTPVQGMGEHTLLARLDLHGDELLVELNSRRRLERARKWLERIQGVRFDRVREHSIEGEDRPLDDRLPQPRPESFPPEMLAFAEAKFRQICWAWLDERVPMLGNLTPRKACRTPEGRRRVAQLVRTMAPMHVPGGTIPPPREEMLRELGIRG